MIMRRNFPSSIIEDKIMKISIDLELDLSSDVLKRLHKVLRDDSIESMIKDKLESCADLLGMSFPPDDDYNECMSVVELLLLDSVSQREHDDE
jgi:hypothetical protein